MKAQATVRLKFPSRRKLETVLVSLEPEVASPSTVRSKASLAKKGDFLLLEIEARDTVALRAALNAYLRWIGSILDVFSMLENDEGN